VNSVIETATTGRSKCRGCSKSIAKGELRFGDSVPNPYGEGDTLIWFHLPCAACMRPEQFLPALNAHSPSPPDADSLREMAEFGVEYPRVARLAHAERAASGRAHCRSCRELIEKGRFRLALQAFEDGRMGPIGSIHVECAEAYFGTADLLERIERLTPELDDEARAELGEALKHQRVPTEEELRLAKTSGEPSEPEPNDVAECDGADTRAD
jgi:hypothetical protein